MILGFFLGLEETKPSNPVHSSINMGDQTVYAKPLRQKSRLIASYPWKTTVLDLYDLAAVFENALFKVMNLTCRLVKKTNTMRQEFAENLMDFEKIISSASTGDGLSLRHFLRFEREYAHLGDLTKALQPSSEVKISSLSTKSRSYLSMLLLAYRTLDIAASLARDCHIDPPPMVGKSIGQNTTVETLSFFFNPAPSQPFIALRSAAKLAEST